MPNLQDVALKAGVSLSTASYALSGKGRITEEVRMKVYDAARELGYRKNIYASMVAANKSSHIGILLHEDPEWTYESIFIRPITENLEAEIVKHNYYPVIIFITNALTKNEILQKINASGVGAVFSIHYGNKELFHQLETQGTPVIVINNSNYQNKFTTVCVDDFQGAYEGAMHLLGLGHRRLAYIDYHRPDMPAVVADRFIGFKKALDEYGIEFEAEERLTVDIYNMAELEEAVKLLLESSRPPTAVFAHDDHLGARIMVVMEKLGFRVPEDISLLAPGDTLQYSEPYIPKITTMQIDTGMLGTLAGELMIKRLNNRVKEKQVIKIKQHLAERGSCIKVKTWKTAGTS